MNKVRVGVAQVSQAPDLSKNLDKALQYMEKAAAHGVQLLCFPEAHLPGYRVGVLAAHALCDEAGLEWATKQIATKCRELCLGVIIGTETPNPKGKPFNSAVVIDRNGEIIARHHKSKLTPKDALAYTSGLAPTQFVFEGVSMGLVICFEGFRFPEATRELAKSGAKVVFHPQFNHVLPGMEWKLPVHEALIIARAAENTIYFVSANMSHSRNNCRSLVVAPNGLIQQSSVLGQEMLLVADIDPDLATHAFLHEDSARRMRALAEI
ncbi:MAG: carbon-nitrogen hydrolase family protein [Anaerolineales bacterium]|nr:carbon-nitrogen hydrolase family protein [Anaerolineales bacterium]